MRTNLSALLLTSLLILSSCSSVKNVVSQVQPEDPSITLVKDGYVKACDTASLGQMADAFLSDPQWTTFTSTDGDTIVELTGEMSYQDLPADAQLQFKVTDFGTSFETSYFSLNGVGQGVFMTSALLSKMCEAV